MRTDARIDRKQVKLPYRGVCTGYDKYRAQFGDIVVFNEGDREYVGRVAGRIDYAPALTGDQKDVRDWLLVITFSQDLSFVFERWVKPEDVVRCVPSRGQTLKLLGFMFSDGFKQHSPDELREWSETGFATPQEYSEYKAKRS